MCSSKQIIYGVPQSSIIGPLFLVYINKVPNRLNSGSPRMYADDTDISYSGSKLSEVKLNINNELSKLNKWFKANNLSLNTAKTEFMVMSSRQRLQTQNGQEINVFVEAKQINRVKNTKSLGLNFVEHPSWNKHVSKISRKISAGANFLKRMRPFIGKETAVKVYKGLIEPYFNYCCPVWDRISGKLCDKLQKVQNRTARVITKSSYAVCLDLVLKRLHWDKLFITSKKHKAVQMCKVLNNHTPDYL